MFGELRVRSYVRKKMDKRGDQIDFIVFYSALLPLARKFENNSSQKNLGGAQTCSFRKGPQQKIKRVTIFPPSFPSRSKRERLILPHQVGIFHSKGGRGELGEVWKEKVAGREGVEEKMLQTGIIRFLN